MFIKYSRFQLLFWWQDVAGLRAVYIYLCTLPPPIFTHCSCRSQSKHYIIGARLVNYKWSVRYRFRAFCMYYPETIFDRFLPNRGWGIDKRVVCIRRHVSVKIKCVCMYVCVCSILLYGICDPALNIRLKASIHVYTHIHISNRT